MSKARELADVIGTQDTTENVLQGRKNLIINGAMQVAQRGTSQTSDGYGSVDRYAIGNGTDGTYTLEQSTDAPDDFKYSLKFTTGTADTSLASTQWVSVWQKLEGQNIAHLNYGSSAAKTVTLSFWAKSSLTGSFGGSFVNSANNRSYPFSYSISSANTWEYKSVVVSGDTSGTWLDTNGIGIRLFWGLGIGSDRSGTDGAWAADELMAPTGSVSVIGTASATWQITGVQLEVGSVATPFEHRSYGEELALCQRYFYRIGDNGRVGLGYMSSGTEYHIHIPQPVTMRATPALTSYGTTRIVYEAVAWYTVSTMNISSEARKGYLFITGTTSTNIGTSNGHSVMMGNGADLGFDAEF